MCPGLTRNFVFLKIPEFSDASTGILGYYSICILCVNTLSKIVSHYDFSVLYMSVMGFHNKNWRVDGVNAIQFLSSNFWKFFNFVKPLTGYSFYDHKEGVLCKATYVILLLWY